MHEQGFRRGKHLLINITRAAINCCSHHFPPLYTNMRYISYRLVAGLGVEPNKTTVYEAAHLAARDTRDIKGQLVAIKLTEVILATETISISAPSAESPICGDPLDLNQFSMYRLSLFPDRP